MASLGLVALMCVSVQADLFTSMAEMQDLLDSEKAIPAVLYKYIEDEQERLVQLRELARQYQEKNDAAIKTGVEDISNPVNAFLLIRKKIFEWRAIESEMLANKADDFIERMSNANYRIRYPTEFRYCFREFCFPILLVVSSLSVHGLVYRFAMVMTRSKAARGGNSVYSGAVDDESSSMEEVNNSAKVSLFVKRAFAKFIEKFQSVVRERDDLRGENRLLRKKFGIPEDLDLNDLSFPPNSVDPHEFERNRSVIISGIPELQTGNMARKGYGMLYSDAVAATVHMKMMITKCYKSTCLITLFALDSMLV
ncbi:hypothetical protein Y032_0508g2709 [Ancylostoma ceylanicum]|uniref:Prolyl 4-hydroxylase N-terminal domain-containing protein n=1 Tax=Ancylostoma ceylanicum TaxID=53326 RepID=A0A016WT56_9BILA|nr:hypothetical protein Y032_0508g2709 [Ancylostoma ceylanicum]